MNIAIIVAAGSGIRMGGSGEGRQLKQFRELAGTPILIHTIKRFENCASVGEIIVVVPARNTSEFLGLANKYQFRKVARVLPGGASRTESVWRGLQAVRSQTAEIIAVHDGVRPFVTPGEIDQTICEAQKCGAAILVAPATDTIKEIEDGYVKRTLPRQQLRHAQTPQCFRYELLRRAYEQALAEGIDAPDDSALVERLGIKVATVEGETRNIKITRPEDLILAEILLREFDQ